MPQVSCGNEPAIRLLVLPISRLDRSILRWVMELGVGFALSSRRSDYFQSVFEYFTSDDTMIPWFCD